MKKYLLSIGFIILLSLPGQTFSGISGDINSDGKIDLKEAIYALQVVSGISPRTEYRKEMRDFIQSISVYAKGIRSDFIVIPQNGHELLTQNGEKNGPPVTAYLKAIDGIGREDLFYGYDNDNQATSISDRDCMLAFMNIAENNGLEVLTTDYCSTPSFMDDSYTQNAKRGYISFAASHRELDNIPVYPANPHNINSLNINSLKQAKNFLYLINPGSYGTRHSFLSAIQKTNYDIIITDVFYEGKDELSSDEVAALKIKANGSSRLVIAYMSIGEAEMYRYYWKTEWNITPPPWLAGENPNWPGNYKVRYWDKNWQYIICGNNDSYLKKILDAGFDGVYMDIVDAYEYFESQ